MRGYAEGDPEIPPINIDPALYPNAPPSATAPPGTSGSGNPGNVNSDPNVQVNPPQFYNPGGGQPYQLINDLGYNPSYPYGNFGSGVPTQKAFGVLGNFVGGGLGSLAFPGLGGLIGSKLGGIGARMLTRWAQQQGQGQGGTSGGGSGFQYPAGGYFDPAYLRSIGYGPGQGTGSLWPGGTGNWGYNQDNPDSRFYDPVGPAAGGFGGGVAGGGGSFFHDLGGVQGGPLAGSFAGLGAGSGGSLEGNFGNMYGGEILRHALQFGMLPQNAFGGAAGTWTPAMIQHYQTQGLPNPGALYGGGNSGNKPGAGLPMRGTV